MIRELIGRLAAGGRLTREEARTVMREIMAGEATPAQIAAYLTALRIRGETAEVIAGSAEAMRECFTAIRAPHDRVVDTCGTGGDGAKTFNISTAAAFVAAGAGATVAKHGNRSVSSACGSADVLAALGVNLDLSPDRVERCLAETGIAFLFAPLLHPAMKHAIGPRREIGIRTVFNILGPLSNPAGARRGVLGVYDAQLVGLLAEAALELGAVHLFVVHGSDGLDEITLTGPTAVAEVRDGRVQRYELHPEEVGLRRCGRGELSGGDAAANAAMLREVLGGAGGPRRDVVCLNAAAAIVAAGLAADLREGVQRARAAIDSGAALAKLEALIAFSRAA
ncbi:MAG: anthranilate phosphoribosyltransferase [Kiritimatiellae bacterium]|nr:anthranilate phosphoribosyltransferase [Kiritimatiellia bacterium]